MTATTFVGHFLGPGVHASRPATTGLPDGTMYVCTTHSKIERVVSGAWVDYATLGVAAGSPVVATDPIFDAKGDLVAGSGADTAARLPVGSNNQVLTADSAQTLGVKWAAVPGGGYVAVDTIWDAKGDLAVASAADTAAKLAVGTNGQVLTADSAQTLGVKWATPTAGAGVAGDSIWDSKGDLAAASGADTAAKLAVGTNGQVLTADSAQTLGIKWATPAGSSGGMTKLFDSTLGSAAASIDTGASGIAAGYAALELVFYLRLATVGDNAVYLRLNNDSAGNYDSFWVTSNASGSATSGQATSTARWDIYVPSSGSTASTFGAARMTIPNYDNTAARKTATWQDGYVDSAGSDIRVFTRTGIWKSTAAITRVSITGGGGTTIATGSRMIIWGLN